MKDLATAIDLDINGHAMEAAAKYEQALDDADVPVEAYLNLAVLYWRCTDIGYSSSRRLPAQFVRHAGRRIDDVLRRAEEKYPDSYAAIGWRKLIHFLDLGDDVVAEHCRQNLHRNCEPCLLYYTLTEDPIIDVAELSMLLTRALREPTARSQYIASVVQPRLQGLTQDDMDGELPWH
jgi:hypothetical protein